MTGPSSQPLPLTPSGTRAAAAAMVRSAVPDVPPHTATTVIDALDLITRTVLLDVLGLTPAQALDLCEYLWRPPPLSHYHHGSESFT